MQRGGAAGCGCHCRLCGAGGPWLHWHHWSSGGTDTKGRARRQKKGWHRRGLDTGNAGVAAGSSPSRTEEMWKESHKLLSRAIGQHGLPARVDTPQCRSAERTLQGLLQELPALTHVTCPSSLSPFPVPVSTLSTPLLRHANSPLPKAAYFSTLPPPRARTTSVFVWQHQRSQKKHVGKPPLPPQPQTALLPLCLHRCHHHSLF